MTQILIITDQIASPTVKKLSQHRSGYIIYGKTSNQRTRPHQRKHRTREQMLLRGSEGIGQY